MKYERLFQPITINGMSLKNRVVMTAIHLVYSDDGTVNDKIKNFYWRRAEGGVAMTFVGGVASDKYVGYPAMLRIDDDKYIASFSELADGMHKRGAKLGVQLLQTGRYGMDAFIDGDDSTISASAIPSKITPSVPREMTVEEIRTVQHNAAQAALRCKKAGADCVELTAGSGYMIAQFLSPVTNHRSDEYGGCWENRCRFGIEMILAVRQAVGMDYPIALRVAGNEFMNGGNGLAECVDFCKKAEEAGVDMFDVTGGWHETAIPQLPGDVPRGGFVYLAKAVKDAVSVPVLSANRHNTPDEAELVLALGQADIIGQCRTQIADPDWVIKVQSERPEALRKCLACNQGCLANVFSCNPCKCLLNPEVGNEGSQVESMAEVPKKILVIGGGVAGCEFALRSATRGHSVVLWEKADALGGKLPIVAAPPAKREFSEISVYYNSQLRASDVKVELNKEASLEKITDEAFDLVVVATGSTPKRFALPGDNTIPVYTADEILSRKAIAGKNVIVVGGGSVGCETADYLAQEASLSEDKLFFMMSQQSESPELINGLLNTSDRKIAIVDIAKIGANFDFGCGWPVLKDLARLGVKLFSKTQIVNLNSDSMDVKFTDKKSGEEVRKSIPCDTIIMAVGYDPENKLFTELSEAGIKTFNLGDSAKVGKIMDAIAQAKELAESI